MSEAGGEDVDYLDDFDFDVDESDVLLSDADRAQMSDAEDCCGHSGTMHVGKSIILEDTERRSDSTSEDIIERQQFDKDAEQFHRYEADLNKDEGLGAVLISHSTIDDCNEYSCSGHIGADNGEVQESDDDNENNYTDDFDYFDVDREDALIGVAANVDTIVNSGSGLESGSGSGLLPVLELELEHKSTVSIIHPTSSESNSRMKAEIGRAHV